RWTTKPPWKTKKNRRRLPEHRQRQQPQKQTGTNDGKSYAYLYSPLHLQVPRGQDPRQAGRAAGPSRRFTRVKRFMIVKYSTLWERIQDASRDFIRLKYRRY